MRLWRQERYRKRETTKHLRLLDIPPLDIPPPPTGAPPHPRIMNPTTMCTSGSNNIGRPSTPAPAVADPECRRPVGKTIASMLPLPRTSSVDGGIMSSTHNVVVPRSPSTLYEQAPPRPRPADVRPAPPHIINPTTMWASGSKNMIMSTGAGGGVPASRSEGREMSVDGTKPSAKKMVLGDASLANGLFPRPLLPPRKTVSYRPPPSGGSVGAAPVNSTPSVGGIPAPTGGDNLVGPRSSANEEAPRPPVGPAMWATRRPAEKNQQKAAALAPPRELSLGVIRKPKGLRHLAQKITPSAAIRGTMFTDVVPRTHNSEDMPAARGYAGIFLDADNTLLEGALVDDVVTDDIATKLLPIERRSLLAARLGQLRREGARVFVLSQNKTGRLRILLQKTGLAE